MERVHRRQARRFDAVGRIKQRLRDDKLGDELLAEVSNVVIGDGKAGFGEDSCPEMGSSGDLRRAEAGSFLESEVELKKPEPETALKSEPTPPQPETIDFSSPKLTSIMEARPLETESNPTPIDSVLAERLLPSPTSITELHRRIDEHKTIIQMLQTKIQNEERAKNEMHKELDSLTTRLTATVNQKDLLEEKCATLEQSFSDLARNHDEMIQVKDYHKSRLQELNEENFRLRQHIDNELTPQVQQVRQTLEQERTHLTDCISDIKKDISQNRTLIERKESNLYELSRKLEEKVALLKKSETDYQTLHDEYETVLAEAENHRNRQLQYNDKIQRLTEKTSSLERSIEQSRQKEKSNKKLIFERGRQLAARDSQIQKLNEEITDATKLMQQMEQEQGHVRQKLEENRQIASLRKKLEAAETRYNDVVDDFNSYKQRASHELQKQKQKLLYLQNTYKK